MTGSDGLLGMDFFHCETFVPLGLHLTSPKIRGHEFIFTTETLCRRPGRHAGPCTPPQQIDHLEGAEPPTEQSSPLPPLDNPFITASLSPEKAFHLRDLSRFVVPPKQRHAFRISRLKRH